jgi:DegV family protein with EDD domain
MPVAVMTDSTASIPQQLATQWDVKMVPIQIRIGDRVDDESRFDRGEVLSALRAGTEVGTSPPDPAAFFWAYQDAVSAGATEIVSIHLSGRMSATVEVARQAAQQIRVPVHVIDSQTTSMSLGYAVLSAARAAAAGGHSRRVIEAAQRRCVGTAELVYVPTLEYLRRGGRIGAAAAMLGTTFAIKPLLTIRGGEVSPLAKVPGTKRALDRLVEFAASHAAERPVDIALSCATPTEREMSLARELHARIPTIRELVLVEASAVLAAHVGPAVLSLSVAPLS